MNVRTVKLCTLACAVIGIAGALISQPAHAGNYSITDLGTLGGSSSAATSVNNAGQAVGYSATSWGATEGFVGGSGWLSGIYSFASNQSAYANAINDYQVVAGNAYNSNGYSHAFVYYQGQMWDLGTLGGLTSSSLAVNNSGTVVGSSTNSTGWTLAFIWDNVHGMRSLGTLGGYTSNAQGINDQGQVVGQAQNSSHYYHAYLYDGSMHDLGTLGGGLSSSSAQAANNSGQVVGWSNIANSTYLRHGFLYQNGRMQDLGSPAGSSAAFSINSAGVICGTIGSHAAIYASGAWTDLNTRISAGTGWTLLTATHINDTGQIVGSGTINGQRHAFLLTPH